MKKMTLTRIAALIAFMGCFTLMKITHAQTAHGISQSSALTVTTAGTAAYNQELARVYTSISVEARIHPNDDPIVWFIKKEPLPSAPDAVLQQLHANHAYYEKIAHRTIIVSGDETPGSYCVFAGTAFDQKSFLDALSSKLSVRPLEVLGTGSVPTRVFQLSDHGKAVGKLLLVYGNVPNTPNTGLMGYLSEARYKAVKHAIARRDSRNRDGGS